MIEKNKYKGTDLLDRDQAVRDLSKIIASTTEPLTFAVNAPWGSGKTVFVKELWKSHLEKEHQIPCIYFSAWEDEFSEEPLVSILGELNLYIKEKYSEDSEIRKKFREGYEYIDKFLMLAKPIIRTALVGFVKNTTFVDLERVIENYSNQKKEITTFKSQIKTVLKKITGKNKPFVIFIDELDRCRPLYAIEYLERIKHLFDIEELIFILSIDKKQLMESIKSQYGNIETEHYLRKFIDIEYKLPQGNIENFCEILYVNFRLEEILTNKKIIEKGFQLGYLDFIKILTKIFNPTPRALEQLFSKLNIIFKTVNLGFDLKHFRPLIFLLFIKFYNSNLYYRFIKGEEKEKIKTLFQQYKKYNINDPEKRTLILLKVIIDVIGLNDKEFEQLVEDETYNRGNSDSIEDKQYLEMIRKGISDDYPINEIIEKAIDKIEFLDNFYC